MYQTNPFYKCNDISLYRNKLDSDHVHLLSLRLSHILASRVLDLRITYTLKNSISFLKLVLDNFI